MLQRPNAIETSHKVFLKTPSMYAELERIQGTNFIYFFLSFSAWELTLLAQDKRTLYCYTFA